MEETISEEPHQDANVSSPKEEPIVNPQIITSTLQPNEQIGRSKKLFLIIVAVILLLGILGGGGYYYLNNKGDGSKEDNVSDNISTDLIAAKEFLESMYKEFYEPNNIERSEGKFLSKYFTAEAMHKFYVESDYEEGDFFYCTDFLVNGDISGNASPDYGDKVVSRTIEPESDGWFLVTNIWDVIKTPVKVRLQVKSVDGTYKVVDISVEKKDENTLNATGNEEESIPPLEEGISIEDAIIVAENMIVENDKFKGFSNPDEVNYIMRDKYGYEFEECYFVEREWDFKPLYYKNCLFAQSTKVDGETWYSDAPTTRGEGVSSFVGFDGFSNNMIIAPFTESAFNDYLHQIEVCGGKLIEKDGDVKTYKINSITICAFKPGANGISYPIILSKE